MGRVPIFLQMEKSITRSMTEEVYFDMIKQKTASLFATSCELGAITTTKDNQDRSAMHLFGEYLGMAFQIKDDLFDLLGKENETGKNGGGDVKKNMATLPLIYSKKNISRISRRELDSLLGKKNKNRKIMARICHIIEETGGIEYTNKKLNEFSDLAVSKLKEYPNSYAKKALIDLVAFNTYRIN